MDIENYVLDNFLNKITKMEDDGQKYILEEDIEKLHLTVNEKKFVFQVMEKNKIKLKKDLIDTKHRIQKVSEFNFGDKETYGLENRDVPKKAEIEYTDEGVLVFENYEKLDEFIEKEFIPNNVFMTRKRDSEDPDKELVGLIQRQDGMTMKQYKKQLYPTIQLNQIVKLRLSEKETAHVMNYLNKEGIVVRGRDSSIDQEFENYDYYTTYKNQILPTALTKEECAQKFAIYSVTKDPVIKEQLILGNLRLVPYVAWWFSIQYDKDINELESYGYEGLIEAIDRFDPTLGNSFSTYAVSYIKNHIKNGRPDLDYLSRGDWANTFYKCKEKVEKATGQTLNENPKLANDINESMFEEWQSILSDKPEASVAIIPSKDPLVLEGQIRDNLDRIRFICMENIDDYGLDDSEKFDESLENIKDIKSDFDLDDSFEKIALKEDLDKVLSTLTEREANVLRLRFGLDGQEPKNLEEVGKIYNVPRERIRQIEAKALRKLRHPSRSVKLRDYIYEDSISTKKKMDNKIFNNNASSINLGSGSLMDPESEAYKKFAEEWNRVTSQLKENFDSDILMDQNAKKNKEDRNNASSINLGSGSLMDPESEAYKNFAEEWNNVTSRFKR